jgi:type IV pilus assembly protein PilN
MIKINLLPVREKVKKENVRRQISIGILLIVLGVAVMGLLLFQQYSQLGELKEEKAKLEQQLAALKKEVGDLSKIRQQKEALEKRKEAIASLSKNRLRTVQALDKLLDAKPKSLFFTSLEQKGQPGAPWEDFSLTISGISTDNEVVAQFMRNLKEQKAIFKAVDLDLTKAKTIQKEVGAYQEYKVEVQVGQERPPAPPPGPATNPPAPPAGPAKKAR